ncbi:MAG: CoA-binding protein [Thermodesulfobacteriota bacterium]|nr:CoA-binding protein [Thermodesulfobacteriota bacterium]
MSKNIIKELDPVFNPESVAIIGASSNPAKWGGMILNQALISGFRGRIYPINPKENMIFGLKTYHDILEVPDKVDLAVFTIPAAHMPAVMRNCVQKGVKGGVIISADFSETGAQGKALEDETVKIAQTGGLRFIGPNGNGMWTSSVGLNVSPFPHPAGGPLAFISQSGTFRGVAARTASARGFGFSKSISIGNQADLQAEDYLEYFAHDDDTKVIAIYMEGFKDGRKFIEIAKKVAKLKPILIFKGGSSDIGAKATMSHTASIAGADEIFNAMCQQIGLMRVYEVSNLFVMAEALFSQPLPRGNRIAIVGNGGQGVIVADYLSSLGIDIPEFKEKDQNRLRKVMPPHAPTPYNPVDFAAGAMEAMDEVRIIEMLASFEYIDGIITNVPMERSFKKSLPEQKKDIITAIDTFSKIPEKYGKPIITQRWNISETVADILKSTKIPVYDSSEDCALAMSALVRYAQIKYRDSL